MTERGFTSVVVASVLVLGLPLAACNSSQTASTVSTATVPAAPTAPARVATGAPRAPGGANFAAEDICVKAVQQQTNAEGVAVLGSQAGAAETVVMIGYPASSAPWRCVVAPEGHVTEVTVLRS